MRMRGKFCPEAWACWLLAKLPVPERVGLKVLLIPTKSLFREETLGEEQEPPRIHAGEVSDIARIPVPPVSLDEAANANDHFAGLDDLQTATRLIA